MFIAVRGGTKFDHPHSKLGLHPFMFGSCAHCILAVTMGPVAPPEIALQLEKFNLHVSALNFEPLLNMVLTTLLMVHRVS